MTEQNSVLITPQWFRHGCAEPRFGEGGNAELDVRVQEFCGPTSVTHIVAESIH
jgi:hypothetical protein